jgi:predicted HNH restriction endonuclease
VTKSRYPLSANLKDDRAESDQQIDSEGTGRDSAAGAPSTCNSKLVRATKRHYGTVCRARGFDFAARYGKLGGENIEVHQKWRIANAGRHASTVTDIDVLCANCHRNNLLTLAGLKNILAEHPRRHLALQTRRATCNLSVWRLPVSSISV